MLTRVALYARVSSEQQVQTSTIESQILAMQERIKNDGYLLLKEFQFLDDGYSGSTLERPGLECLRDAAANHLFDKIYVYAPDRLARKYAYQFLLIEELNKLGIEIVFLNNTLADNPESNLLLQVQGMIAEYERTKIIERCRRGRVHAAKQGFPSALVRAPYGYRYIKKQINGIGGYEIIEEEAKVVRLIFSWIGYERMSINGAAKRLTKMGIQPKTKVKTKWSRSTLGHLLRNPAYKGKAAFGRNKSIAKRSRLRPAKGQPLQSKNCYSLERIPEDKWITIPVPAIVDEALFDTVQEQLEENKRIKRAKQNGPIYLLQGLTVCSLCEYAYTGSNTYSKKYNYYICNGRQIFENEVRVCNNNAICANTVEELVWKEIQYLLNNPCYLETEYQRRIEKLKKSPTKEERNKLNAEKLKVKGSIARLIDSYAEGFIEKPEFEPRIKEYQWRLSEVEQKLLQLVDDQTYLVDLQKIIGKMEEFSKMVKEKLEGAIWQTKRDIITALIKRVEIGKTNVNIVFRVDPYIPDTNSHLLRDCPRNYSFLGNPKPHNLMPLLILRRSEMKFF
jgi:site-specific DNA recombinase